MCWVPYPLAFSEPVVHSWNLQGLFRPGEERELVAEYVLKWCQIVKMEFWAYSAQGSNRLNRLSSMTEYNVQAPGSYAQSGCLSGDGIRNISWMTPIGASIHVRWTGDPDLTLCPRVDRNSGTHGERDSLHSGVQWVGLSGGWICMPWRNGSRARMCSPQS